jgi:hypothetical protein
MQMRAHFRHAGGRRRHRGPLHSPVRRASRRGSGPGSRRAASGILRSTVTWIRLPRWAARRRYNGNGINHAVALDGKRYTELATAFAYREKIIPGCTCNGRDAFGLVTTPIADDPTLRPGDIVATNTGLMAYSAGPNGSTFTSISTYAGLSADMRRRLAETKIEPAAEEPARPPPVREAEAMPARSVRNKQAQVDR